MKLETVERDSQLLAGVLESVCTQSRSGRAIDPKGLKEIINRVVEGLEGPDMDDAMKVRCQRRFKTVSLKAMF